MSVENNFLGSLIDDIVSEAETGSPEESIVDIITFCEHVEFLNMVGQNPPMKLWPMQKIVLKLFYRGSRGNEHINLTEEERQIMDDIANTESLDYDSNNGGFRQITEKYDRGNLHNTLLLVMGRRSSKTLMVSIIAAYEAYKLVELKNPHEYYTNKGVEIAAGKPIAILNVAVSATQAYDPLFLEIEARITRSNYFRDKVNYQACKKGTIYLLTDADREEIRRREREGITLKVDGSIVLMSGHSNSNSLRGKASIAILFDEFAHFIQTDGRTSGDEAYRALVPSTRQFGADGRIVLLSDPKGKEGMFWKLFQMSTERTLDPNGEDLLDDNGIYIPKDDKILALQIPTWRMNPTPDLSRKVLEREEKNKDPISFACTYGARFMGEEGAKFFDETRLTNCIDFSAGPVEFGDPKHVYYIHLDPATTSHNYALAMVHPVTFTNRFGEIKRKVFLDLLKFWRPSEEGPVDINDVQRTIIDLCRRFRVVSVTFDQWQSAQTIQNLKAARINAYETKFVTGFITAIYGEMKTLINLGDLVLYPNRQLIGEMKCLKYKILRSGFKRFFDDQSEFPSDDCCDAVAGAVYQSLHAQFKQSLPRGGLVWTGGR
jgi:hypothetical protein